jgi:hypothetical protein
MTTNSNVPGLYLPTVTAPLAGTPGASAMAARNNQVVQQAALAKAVSGGFRKMRRGGANRRGGAITVPQMPGDTSGANAVLAQNSGISVQSAANAQYDKVGGKRRRRSTKKRRRSTKKRRTRRHRK